MKSILCVVLLSLTQFVMADSIDQQSLQLCEKVKSCAVSELEGQDMPADMKAMVMSSMEGMCAVMATEFNNEQIKQYEDLRQQAQACISSISSLSCSQLMDGQTNTAECIKLEKDAATYQ